MPAGSDMRRRNIAAALGLIVCGLIYGYLSWGLPQRSLPNTPGPSFFPLVVTVLLLALSVALLIQGIAADRDVSAPGGDAATRLADRRLTFVLLATIFAYVVLLPVLGFILATIPFFAALTVLYGERRPILVLISALIMTAILYGVFRHVFGIFLPRGLLAGIVA